jgi:hypothetical protein
MAINAYLQSWALVAHASILATQEAGQEDHGLKPAPANSHETLS